MEEERRYQEGASVNVSISRDFYAPSLVVTAVYRDPRLSNDPTELALSEWLLPHDQATSFSSPHL